MKSRKNLVNTTLYLSFFIFFLCKEKLQSQNIKTIQLRPTNSKQFTPIVKLGNTLKLSFDDLDADNKEYQYKIEHMTAEWKPSNLQSNQYINGFEQNYINTVSNSFNTLQNYTHYSVEIPNQSTRITKSGNYLISILDEDSEVVFTRRCVFYKPKTIVGIRTIRSRNTKTLNKKQTVQFIINHKGFNINNPAQEIKVILFQNHNWNTAVTGLQPQFFKQNQLIYNYVNKTDFWGGNEFRNFDTKSIRNANLQIAKTEQKDIWHTYLYTDEPKTNRTYTYNPDINGQFVIRTLEGNNPNDEADYSMVHFSLNTHEPYKNKNVYIYGAFNNFELTEENKMSYNQKDKSYSLPALLKQGFYNYSYVTVNNNDEVSLSEIDGSFFETENEYTVIVYYHPFGGLYDQVIGVSSTSSLPK